MFRLNTSRWHIIRINFLMAGVITLIASSLAIYLDDLRFLILAGFVGVMQTIFALTGYCPSAIILDRLGIPRA